jgi:hypothetical protein
MLKQMRPRLYTDTREELTRACEALRAIEPRRAPLDSVAWSLICCLFFCVLWTTCIAIRPHMRILGSKNSVWDLPMEGNRSMDTYQVGKHLWVWHQSKGLWIDP